MSAQVIHDGLRATRDDEAVAYSRAMKYLRAAWFDPTTVPSNPDASSPHPGDSDRAMLAAMEEKLPSLVPETPVSHPLPFTED
jgi:hypothetical protein